MFAWLLKTSSADNGDGDWMKCPHCGNRLIEESNKGLRKTYPLVCPYCDENMFLFEVVEEYPNEVHDWLVRRMCKMDEEIRRMFDLKDMGKCPFCRKPVNVEKFRDELSLKEYRISGLCQSCQDDFFKH